MARKKYDDEMAHILYSAMKDSKEAKKASKSLKSVGTAIGKKIKSFVRKAPLFAALGVYYAFTGPTDTQVENKKDYYLPDQITVTDTNLPHKTVGLEKIINIKDIDFSGHFWIKTDRYTYVKDEDWLTSRAIGHVMTIPGKILFWDWNYGLGQDEHRARASLSMVENNKDIRDITIRVNHNEALYDMTRLYRDDDLIERNNWLARSTMGIMSSIFGELRAEFFRGSYYNPMTRTAVCYTNIESVLAHEIGHHVDYQRFDSDWEYTLAGLFPPTTLYKEWQASQNAKKYLSADDQYQFNRYLIPAFLTYLIGGYVLSRTLLRKDTLKTSSENIDSIIESDLLKLYEASESNKSKSFFGKIYEQATEKIINERENQKKNLAKSRKKYARLDQTLKDKEKQRKKQIAITSSVLNDKISMPQVFRHYATLNTDLYAGIATYNACESAFPGADIKYLAFGAALIITHKIINATLGKIIPYTYEKINKDRKKNFFEDLPIPLYKKPIYKGQIIPNDIVDL